ncbi:hypothetical protein [Ammoniphilus resinae]|uniref:Lipoprotein n=1 Tax=Ammoniphilus resinae TaxID=861532 RepID=A0ABS4GP00_9BACL|nr:hypothetical protein [Ammoniphilus resinae]MBP1931995.1 hypothetical protein [Ammoniphilus resinae]
MRRWFSLYLVFSIILMFPACDFKRGTGTPPPSPPTPFPIELETQLKEYIFQNNSGIVTLQMRFKTNEKTDNRVVISSELFQDENTQWIKQNQQKLLNEKIEFNEERLITYTLPPLKEGRYRLLLTAEYGSYGKQNHIIFLISRQGKLTLERDLEYRRKNEKDYKAIIDFFICS